MEKTVCLARMMKVQYAEKKRMPRKYDGKSICLACVMNKFRMPSQS